MSRELKFSQLAILITYLAQSMVIPQPLLPAKTLAKNTVRKTLRVNKADTRCQGHSINQLSAITTARSSL